MTDRCSLADFAKIKGGTLDLCTCDVLYLLDCCYPSAAAMSPGKELIAASAFEPTEDSGHPDSSFTEKLVEVLQYACIDRTNLTVAQIWSVMLAHAHKGNLELMSIHTEMYPSPSPCSSIILTPLTEPKPYTAMNVFPLGTYPQDIRALLSITVREANPAQLSLHLRTWLSNKPGGFEDVGVGIESVNLSKASCLVILKVPLSLYYCMSNHEGVAFLGFVGEEDTKELVRDDQHASDLQDEEWVRC